MPTTEIVQLIVNQRQRKWEIAATLAFVQVSEDKWLRSGLTQNILHCLV